MLPTNSRSLTTTTSSPLAAYHRAAAREAELRERLERAERTVARFRREWQEAREAMVRAECAAMREAEVVRGR